ncbi:DUF5107 domain-containing protein [Verrucomicrobiaceae bacterium N1E253]|uniref:DUF5107 domain-containing protein n=1 Tax=Oceaniferula marina TaxID=2748318 RepID=A0A851GED0_9BACT|nr:DUF5107 domain-containing protein [Oceaniferula marina]NWK55272.1 DUF5107 domain-containing protein [Oceaniferula marina]
MSVQAHISRQSIPTYPLGEPEKNPLFFEKRVYQGSCGKVYPVPFVDKVYDEPVDASYQSVLLENDFVRLSMLPEIGGRIFTGQDKTNNNYDFFYRQDVIKPALVGLAGPWISGGVEFNWPQHHRPGTYLPTDIHIEEESDGARTVWMSEHDPLNRLKGMHGIRLRPDSSLIELRARLYNRTPLTHTFLWWANVAAMVHDQYQSFFPPDVHYVADHAVRAMSSFPVANNPYYDIPYQDRPDANDLSWYKNIPVPTSYMVCQTNDGFFGGYDHLANGGFVHVANRHVSPGKKQWTWGNDAFGWAWDRELTDNNGPYVELMAGVFTDNQPDFTYLAPYETKTFSQFWWPIQNIGPVQQANQEAALACSIREDRNIELGLCVSKAISEAKLILYYRGELLTEFTLSLQPGESWKNDATRFPGESPADLQVRLLSASGQAILKYQGVDPSKLERERPLATEPPMPEDIPSQDSLFLTGEHLEQYRHPTRNPEDYWNEALERDPADCRCHLALGKRLLERGQLTEAAQHLNESIQQLTHRHPNPVTGEAHYFLGLCLLRLGKNNEAYPLFYKATWDYAWRSPAYYQIACIDACRHDWASALEHLESSLDTNRQNNKAQVLKAAIRRPLGETDAASTTIHHLLDQDPLDHWARFEQALISNDPCLKTEFLDRCRNDAQTILDLVFDYIEAGFHSEALLLLEWHHSHPVIEVAVPNPSERSAMTRYVQAWLEQQAGIPESEQTLSQARDQSSDYFFPSRAEEMLILEWAIEEPGGDPLACYALGNYYYDKKRHADAIRVWQTAEQAQSKIPQIYRNLGIAVWNQQHDYEQANHYYQRAIALAPSDARLIAEADQLADKGGRNSGQRLAFLENHRELVMQRDDAVVALATLLNESGRPDAALDLIISRRFHPWEGGEGMVLKQYTTAHLLLGQKHLDGGNAEEALKHFRAAMDTPESLGEAYHPLQAKANVNYWLGRSLNAMGKYDEAASRFTEAAEEIGDFAGMEAIEHSPLSYYRGLALLELDRKNEANALFESLLHYGKQKLQQKATIDYFATSLPNLLVFDDDLQARQDQEARSLIKQAEDGLQMIKHT